MEAPLTFSTVHAPATKRLGCWEELLSQRVMTLDVQSDHSEFGGRIVEAPLAALRAYRISADNYQRARHSRLDHAPTDQERFCLIQLRHGGFDLTSRGKNANLALGDCALVTTAEPFKFHCPEFTSCLVLRFDETWIRRVNPNIRELIGARIDGCTGWGRALSATLFNIEPNDIAEWSYPATAVADQIAGLLSLTAEAPIGLTSPKRSALERARELLQARFHEADLSPQLIATALGISKRYLHQLFAQRNSTFTQELYALRLAQAQRLASDRRFANLTVTELGLACGFNDASHFSRCFRAKFGIAPTHYRAQTLRNS